MYSIIEKKKVALGLLEQVLHKKKKEKEKITWSFLKCIWKQLETSQEQRSPSIPWTSSCGLGLSP